MSDLGGGLGCIKFFSDMEVAFCIQHGKLPWVWNGYPHGWLVGWMVCLEFKVLVVQDGWMNGIIR